MKSKHIEDIEVYITWGNHISSPKHISKVKRPWKMQQTSDIHLGPQALRMTPWSTCPAHIEEKSRKILLGPCVLHSFICTLHVLEWKKVI